MPCYNRHAARNENIVDTLTSRLPSLASNDESRLERCIAGYLYYRIEPVKYAAISPIILARLLLLTSMAVPCAR